MRKRLPLGQSSTCLDSSAAQKDEGAEAESSVFNARVDPFTGRTKPRQEGINTRPGLVRLDKGPSHPSCLRHHG